MNSRVCAWAVLACAGLIPACFETKIITADSGESGGKSSAGGGNGNSGASSGGNGGGSVTASFNSKECLACEDIQCKSEASKCKALPGCSTYLSCLFDCGSDANCAANCAVSDANATAAAATLASCAVLKCDNECFGTQTGFGGSGGVSGSGNGGKTGSGGATSGGSGNGGTTSAGSGGTTSTGSGGASFGGNVTGSGGQLAGITWLSFEGSAARAMSAPNSELGIDGILYGYSDSCATLSWDKATRCATGTLCAPGASFANWGVAVGFDFNNTGDEGMPANTKRVWNPSEHGVRGVAWELTGTAPALQLWVLNMDPSHHGECSDSLTCDIAGPPDGAPTPQLNGQLLFSNMRKDDWGGSGIAYTFDPAAVHALQFKLPAVIAGAASFSFCVNRVGVIR